jgi:hypothetical protein
LRVDSMNIWKQLYAMVWLAFLQIVIILITLYVPGFKTYLVYGHTFLGLVILGLAHYNSAQIKRTEAPSRLKRIVKSTAALATLQIILGVILFASVILAIGIPFIGVIAFFHIVTALAIITQASSVATAYDMWEEKEYTK